MTTSLRPQAGLSLSQSRNSSSLLAEAVSQPMIFIRRTMLSLMRTTKLCQSLLLMKKMLKAWQTRPARAQMPSRPP